MPELPVRDLDTALDYYARRLGFTIDFGEGGGGIAGISQGHCRLFLTTMSDHGPARIWLNLDSKEEVDALHDLWRANGATIDAPPESKPWGLHEFTATDPDGNLLRVFYDFATPAL
ncbi:MAG TPA: VOC family protein [Thermoanaerobaculia bacterium]